MSKRQSVIKRSFDIFLALSGLVLFGWSILLCWVIATIDTRKNGFYVQNRVGKDSHLFPIIKIRTMRPVNGITTVVTSSKDPRITRIGAWFRRSRLDELPQLINVLLGHMSFVGPRPDVEGFADILKGEDRIILSVRPGITGPATLFFLHEEDLLAKVDHPERYNRKVIYPAKVKINRCYIDGYSFGKDVLYLAATFLPGLREQLLSRFKKIYEV